MLGLEAGTIGQQTSALTVCPFNALVWPFNAEWRECQGRAWMHDFLILCWMLFKMDALANQPRGWRSRHHRGPIKNLLKLHNLTLYAHNKAKYPIFDTRATHTTRYKHSTHSHMCMDDLSLKLCINEQTNKWTHRIFKQDILGVFIQTKSIDIFTWLGFSSSFSLSFSYFLYRLHASQHQGPKLKTYQMNLVHQKIHQEHYPKARYCFRMK